MLFLRRQAFIFYYPLLNDAPQKLRWQGLPKRQLDRGGGKFVILQLCPKLLQSRGIRRDETVMFGKAGKTHQGTVVLVHGHLVADPFLRRWGDLTADELAQFLQRCLFVGGLLRNVLVDGFVVGFSHFDLPFSI